MADLESIGPYGPEIDLPARSLQQQFAQQIPVPGGLRRKEDQQRIVLTAAGEDMPEVPADIDALRRDPATAKRRNLRTRIAAIRKRNATPAGRVVTAPAQTDATLPQEHDIFPDIHLHSFVTGLSNSTHICSMAGKTPFLTNTS